MTVTVRLVIPAHELDEHVVTLDYLPRKDDAIWFDDERFFVTWVQLEATADPRERRRKPIVFVAPATDRRTGRRRVFAQLGDDSTSKIRSEESRQGA